MKRKRKLCVGLIFGGRTDEHDVSLASAQSVLRALDPAKYQVVLIGVTKEGRWLTGGNVLKELVQASRSPLLQSSNGLNESTADVPSSRKLTRLISQCDDGAPPDAPSATPSSQKHTRLSSQRDDGMASPTTVPEVRSAVALTVDRALQGVDVVFPLIHGPNGEDGTIQGLLELADVPYVGAGVAASAVGMDKVLMKALFRAAGLPVVDYLVVLRHRWRESPEATIREIESAIGYPCFVKPANLGSSVGVSKARNWDELTQGLATAAEYDRKLLVERAVNAREIECSVLGNEIPRASLPGEVIPAREFYDYAAKYTDARTRLVVPAALSAEQTQRVQELAVRAFQTIDCSGMARVDFFLDREDGRIWVNEINTIPGFTAVSMYPKMWEASGLSYTELIDRLIELALERHADKRDR